MEDQIKSELDLLRGELISACNAELEIINRVSASIGDQTATPETINTEMLRLAAVVMNTEHGVRSWRHESGIVPRIPPMAEDLGAGQHPLATFELPAWAQSHPGMTVTVGTVAPGGYAPGDAVTLESLYPGGPLTAQVFIFDGGANRGPKSIEYQKSQRDEQQSESGGESTTDPEVPSTPTGSPTIEASGTAPDSPAPESNEIQPAPEPEKYSDVSEQDYQF